LQAFSVFFAGKNRFWGQKYRASNDVSGVRRKVLPASIRARAPTKNRDYQCCCTEQPVDRKIFLVFVLDERPLT